MLLSTALIATAAEEGASQEQSGFDPLTIIMLVVMAGVIFLMFRSSRKRRRTAEQMQDQVVPGAEVMTNFGLFGTVIAVDTDNSKVVLETSPGNTMTVHRQAIAKVVTEDIVVPDSFADDEEHESGSDDQTR